MGEARRRKQLDPNYGKPIKNSLSKIEQKLLAHLSPRERQRALDLLHHTNLDSDVVWDYDDTQNVYYEPITDPAEYSSKTVATLAKMPPKDSGIQQLICRIFEDELFGGYVEACLSIGILYAPEAKGDFPVATTKVKLIPTYASTTEAADWLERVEDEIDQGISLFQLLALQIEIYSLDGVEAQTEWGYRYDQLIAPEYHDFVKGPDWLTESILVDFGED